MTVKNLLDFISGPESNGDYNAVWGGIKRSDRPSKPLTEMTVREVLDWQDSIDAKYMSEAAGRYQIMEDTLRGLYREAGVPLSAKYDEKTQDKLGEQLLRRRGLDDYLAGKMTAEKFANSLAKEWAGLPVVSGPKKGKSYYGGDGLNASHVKVGDFMHVVLSTKGKPQAAPPETITQKAQSAAPAAGAGAGLTALAVLDAVPKASGLLGNLAPTAQIIAVVVVAISVGFLLWKRT